MFSDGVPLDRLPELRAKVEAVEQAAKQMTHTYVVVGLSAAAYGEIKQKMLEASYEEQIDADGTIDMHGLAVTSETGEEAPDGWVGWFDGPSEYFWTPDKPEPHELVDGVRPATHLEKVLMEKFGVLRNEKTGYRAFGPDTHPV